MALSIDGVTYGINAVAGTSPLSSSNGGTGNLVTANANDWIIICGFLENESEQGGYPSGNIPTVGGNAATLRNRYQWRGYSTFGNGGAAYNTLEIWYYFAASAINAVVSYPVTNLQDGGVFTAFGVHGFSGGGLVNPWDQAATVSAGFSCAQEALLTTQTQLLSSTSTNQGAASANISTVNANTLIFAVGGTSDNSATVPFNSSYAVGPIAGTTATDSGASVNSSPNAGNNAISAVEYRVLSAIVSGASAAFGTGATAGAWGMMIDALSATGPGGVSTTPFSYTEFPHPFKQTIADSFLFPNLTGNVSGPIPFTYREYPHPSYRPPAEIVLFPNLTGNIPPLTVLPFSYYEFSHPLKLPSSTDWQWQVPNLLLSVFTLPVVYPAGALWDDRPPPFKQESREQSWIQIFPAQQFSQQPPAGFVFFSSRPPPGPTKGPEFVFPNLTGNIPYESIFPVIYYEFSHPPRQKSPDDFKQQNILPEIYGVFPPASYEFFSEHPVTIKAPEFVFPNLTGMIPGAIVNEPFSYHEFSHPAPFVKAQEFKFPNLTGNIPGTVLRGPIYTGHPLPTKGPEFIFPNLVNIIPAVVFTPPQIIYYEFSHPPTPRHADEIRQRNLLPAIYGQFPPASYEFFSEHPVLVKGPEFIFPFLTGNIPGTIINEPFSYFEFSHPPQGRAPEFVLAWLNNRLPQTYSQTPTAAYPTGLGVHPPAYVKGAEFVFPNLAINIPVLAPWLQELRYASFDFNRHPPHYYQTPEFIFPTWIVLGYPAIPTPPNSIPVIIPPYIRKAEAMLAKIRKIAYTLYE